ncbi:hypothetical protein F8388_019721 [Cannabis sativa]|uniref:Uncharacterized protein n=1 Tax=Cannabis sativa TaxID=3483 RepID=A0A7J6DVE2_CANSA|nr:hypothetical protein F8388_019721 [Cannabis sativa]
MAAAVAAVAAAASNGRQHSSSASGGIQPHHDNGSSGHNGSICPSPSEQPPVVDVDDAEKRKQGDADKKIAVFFYSNCIPFGAAKSLCYQEMVDAILECGECPVYIGAQGALGTQFAIMGRTINAPDVISEWPSELDPSTPLLDDSWLDSIPLDSTISP